MNEMEIYFARQNVLWNFSIYFYIFILILIFGVIIYDIGSKIYWKIYDWKKRKENK